MGTETMQLHSFPGPSTDQRKLLPIELVFGTVLAVEREVAELFDGESFYRFHFHWLRSLVQVQGQEITRAIPSKIQTAAIFDFYAIF
jgi:hypothetical protein